MKAPVGLLSDRTVLRSKMEGLCPDKFAFAQRSGTIKSPVGLLSDRTVLRSKMEGPRPDKFAFVERSGAMKAPVGLLSDRTVLRSKMEGLCPDKFQFAVQRQTAEKPLHSKNGCRGFLFVYFRIISPFSQASTTRVLPEASVPSIRRSAAGSSTALRMTRRKSRAPNLPPSAFFTSALRAAGV